MWRLISMAERGTPCEPHTERVVRTLDADARGTTARITFTTGRFPW